MPPDMTAARTATERELAELLTWVRSRLAAAGQANTEAAFAALPKTPDLCLAGAFAAGVGYGMRRPVERAWVRSPDGAALVARLVLGLLQQCGVPAAAFSLPLGDGTLTLGDLCILACATGLQVGSSGNVTPWQHYGGTLTAPFLEAFWQQVGGGADPVERATPVVELLARSASHGRC